jgi:bifunctional non-homologous end joining protein LigD
MAADKPVGGETESLQEYRKKRDFEKTPEPAGGAAEPRPEQPRYLIQKHAASRLHYDLRLELDGVLLSWAVPKGPSLDPKEKRLAAHVEDHPLEYGSFEGIIPEGEYGGGTVMLWDEGWWEPDMEWLHASSTKKQIKAAEGAGPAGMLEQGELKFKLHGKKLKGSFVLVRMKPRPGERGESWLLIKHRDEEATEDGDITEAQPHSVVSGRSLEQIAADAKKGKAPAWDT